MNTQISAILTPIAVITNHKVVSVALAYYLWFEAMRISISYSCLPSRATSTSAHHRSGTVKARTKYQME